ncbi:Pentatricopeptide repeat-containing protein [Thalictrum thalictroides]|uniref:Pentatricopeptide repeat-containing protein n=1 Tax=Thalictrum thalictroides TaxID=46969 RepID=A0A7J6W410_THATH|nr:Pentatricopeptide repeat-containing protein [Thalictrum thalictroides]
MVFLLTIRPHIRRLFTGSGIGCSTTELLEGIQDQHLNQFGFNAQKIFETNTHLKDLVKTGHLQQARYVFDEMPQRDEISWTTIISGYVSAFNASEALVLFSNMRVDSTVRVDPFVLALAFKACACNSELQCGKLIHGYSVKTGFVNSVFVGSALLDMYTKCGCVSMGCRVFDEMPDRNVVSWTAIITGLVRAGFNKEGLRYFAEMWCSDVQCDSYTFASALKACADSGDLKCGKAIHTQTMKAGFDMSSFVANTLATMYSKCGKLDYGVRLFERMKTRDVVSWTMIISAYVQMRQEEIAIHTFVQMRESGVSPNGFTFASVISGCANLGKIVWGKQLHAHVIHLGLLGSLSIVNAIMVMYSKCGQLNSSAMVFHGMPSRDIVSWSTIIAGYSQDSHCKEAFEHFSWMRRDGVKPNEFTLSSLLSVSGNMAILEQGRQLHAHILSIGLEHDIMINSALINMYSKCGSIKEASWIFDAIGSESVVSWTAMINGYAEHGHSKKAIDLFENMCRVGMRPDDVTFIGVLSACTHAGLVDLGFHYFNLMSKKYQINPGKEHYGCIIDLLSRAGRLSDAEQMILSMPFKKDDVVWSSLLTGCRARGDIERGRRAAEHILELNPYCATTHITLCNIYSAEGNWKDAAHVRKRMRSKGVIKEPGWSWIKVQDKVSAFVAGDRSHPLGEDIYCMLDLLVSRTETDATTQDFLP